MALGSVANAAPATVLPDGLCSAFSEVLEVACIAIEHHDGTLERSLLAQTSRRRFRQTRKLTADQHADLLEFWEDRKGGLEPFWFYHCKEATSGYDPTGAASAGRYTVRFASEWADQHAIGRSEAQLELVEIA